MKRTVLCSYKRLTAQEEFRGEVHQWDGHLQSLDEPQDIQTRLSSTTHFQD